MLSSFILSQPILRLPFKVCSKNSYYEYLDQMNSPDNGNKALAARLVDLPSSTPYKDWQLKRSCSCWRMMYLTSRTNPKYPKPNSTNRTHLSLGRKKFLLCLSFYFKWVSFVQAIGHFSMSVGYKTSFRCSTVQCKSNELTDHWETWVLMLVHP